MVRVCRQRSAPVQWTTLGLISAAVLLFPATGRAQVFTIFNSNGFESPTFVSGTLGSYYLGGSGGQQSYLTTDFSQILGTPAGNIQSGTVFAGSQAFQINGSRLFDDSNFSGQTFWYRNYPTPGSAYNPVLNGRPIVSVNYDQRVTSVPLNLNEMPLVGSYMEGYAQTDGTQHALGAVMFNQNGGITAFTLGGNTVSTANGLYTHDAWHHFQVDFDFGAQTYRAFVDGNLITFGAALTNVPFRTSGLDRIAEYGFQASFNEATTVTQNNAFFDGYSIVASGVPEPSSLVLAGVAIAGLRFVRRRRKTA
jgi:PEP-CTERM motif